MFLSELQLEEHRGKTVDRMFLGGQFASTLGYVPIGRFAKFRSTVSPDLPSVRSVHIRLMGHPCSVNIP